ncbi:MAG: GAF domain-containing protein [Anaerolineales bacterium]|uniref:GAF domain-containing protein n=1 Tax=Candidatus Villigracilis proximus TaxID=3140683 RepID=UPI003136B47B|nr:GAF domain-containing protein [Anaerolineales bacterium]
MELAKADFASVFILDKDSQTLEVIGGYGQSPEIFTGRKFPISEGLAGISTRTMKTYISSDTKNDPIASNSLEDVNSEIAVPIITNGQVLGVLN